MKLPQVTYIHTYIWESEISRIMLFQILDARLLNNVLANSVKTCSCCGKCCLHERKLQVACCWLTLICAWYVHRKLCTNCSEALPFFLLLVDLSKACTLAKYALSSLSQVPCLSCCLCYWTGARFSRINLSKIPEIILRSSSDYPKSWC